jgi:hypothetical protein
MKGFMFRLNRLSALWRACLLILLVLAGRSASAQTITSGVIEGVAVDQNAAPLVEVLVQVTSPDGGPARSALTDRSGVFRIALLPAGRYQLSFERLGYRPVIVEDVRVAANTRSNVEVRLVEAPPPVETIDRVVWSGAVTGTRAGASQLLSPFTLDEIPWERRELTELPKLASAASRDFEVEGLPAWLSAVRMDGVPFHPARHPFLTTDPKQLALPINALSVAELITGDADAEWGESAGGTLATNTRRGGNEFGARAFGSWAGTSLRSSDLFASSDISGNSMWGGALLGGAIIRDTAHVVLGLEIRKLQTPAASVWALDEGNAAALINAASGRGEDIAGYAVPYAFESNSITGFGRFDWQLAENNQLSVRGALGNISPGSAAFDLAAAGIPEATATARDILISAALSSNIGRNWAHEIRVGFTSSTREYTEDEALLPSTTIVSGAYIGRPHDLLGDFGRNQVSADQSLRIPFGPHHLKLGLGVGLAMHDNTLLNNGVGEFTFGGAAELAQARGVYVRTSNTAPEVSFSNLHAHAYAQDSWLAAPGVDVVLGVRVDMQTLPATDVRADTSWLTASGLDNSAIEERAISVSPRFGLTWDVGSRGNVMVRVNAGRFAGEVDPLVLADVLAGDGDVTVTRAIGDLNAWPLAPGAAGTPARRLTLLGPSYNGPQSDRFSIGLSSRMGALGTIHISGAYRKTGYLPRYSNLNLPSTPVAQDQHGRALFGTLSQFGQLLTAGTSNRRFRGYDIVSGITADGSAEYRGVTVGLEKDAGRDFRLFGSYTYSQTTDDAPLRRGARAEALLSPFPDALTNEWLEGTSDYDLPHRAVAGIEFTPQTALSPRLTAVYRFQSGYPFTPGYRDGVDANGDGSDSNDVAFVDGNMTGMDELMGQWDCLSGQAGRFAERNSCRGENTHELDVRLGLSVLNSGRTSAQLFVEGINLMDAQFSEPDRALVLIDAARTIQVNSTTGNITVPLVANPNFGQPLLQRGSGRMLRIGIQVNH